MASAMIIAALRRKASPGSTRAYTGALAITTLQGNFPAIAPYLMWGDRMSTIVSLGSFAVGGVFFVSGVVKRRYLLCALGFVLLLVARLV
ncbi:hypothetical protein [Paraburkholderia sp. SIMBA_054]|uniref:hypothetical protein n=1 Tax=Paraburkholderia sp. SIMBA_054 TaxID=3085795 RepID=UPI00397B469D